MAHLIQNDAMNQTKIDNTSVVITDPDMRMAFGKAISGKVTVDPENYSVDIKIDKKKAESLVEEIFKGEKSGITAKYNPRDKKFSISLNVVGTMYKGLGKSKIKSEFNASLERVFEKIEEQQ